MSRRQRVFERFWFRPETNVQAHDATVPAMVGRNARLRAGSLDTMPGPAALRVDSAEGPWKVDQNYLRGCWNICDRSQAAVVLMGLTDQSASLAPRGR
jgi:hypothetical protein